MNKHEIREIIFSKQKNDELLTEEEKTIALQYFSQEEIECMVLPEFDHDTCFSKKHTVIIPQDQLYNFERQDTVL